jgi:hypothetical protein
MLVKSGETISKSPPKTVELFLVIQTIEYELIFVRRKYVPLQFQNLNSPT